MTKFDVPQELIEKTYSTYSTFFSVLTGFYTLPETKNRDEIINKYFDNVDWILRPHLVILSGSPSDADHVNKIKKMAEVYNIQTISHVASAHKNTQKVLNILDFYNSQNGKVIFVAVAGRSNALGGVVACNTDYPTRLALLLRIRWICKSILILLYNVQVRFLL